MSRNFLITGGARGIGRGLTRLLLSANHRVYFIDSNHTELRHAANQLDKTYKAGTDYQCAVASVSDAGVVQNVVSKAKAFFNGQLDCLVNNAAYTKGVGGVPLSDITVEEWNKSLATNLTGPMLMTQACLPLLSAAGGCVINISSTRAHQAEPNNEPYATTKAGILGFTQSAAVSLGVLPHPIRVNAIVPGWINVENECKDADEKGTEWEDGLTTDDHSWHLTGRVGKVEDIAKAVLYLVEAEGVTGTEMLVDGGVTKKMVYPE